MRLLNPSKNGQGGDVPGDTKNDQDDGLGEPITVAKASYDPGYSLETTLNTGRTDVAVADLKLGYCAYGNSTGEPEDY